MQKAKWQKVTEF